jgi:hypothetical protein
MSIFVLLVVVGVNVVQFDVFDLREECAFAAQKAVGDHAGDVDAICVDIKNHTLTDIVGRGPERRSR